MKTCANRALACGLLACVSVAAAAHGQVVINEFDYDQPGTDAAEFIELKIVGLSNVNLSRYTLELWNGANNTIYQSITLPSVSRRPGDYWLIASSVSTISGANQYLALPNAWLQNGAPDGIVIRDTVTGLAVDSVSYEGQMTGITENMTAPTDTGVGNDSIARSPDGTDTNNNNLDFVVATPTPGVSNTVCSIAPYAVLANEVAVPTCVDQTLVLKAESTASSGASFRWRIDGRALFDGIDAIGIVSGAGTQVLTVTHVTGAINGTFDCAVFQACAVGFSGGLPIALCLADFNCDGFVDFTDFDQYVTYFETGDMLADFNADGFLDFTDFDAFVSAFESPC